MVCEWLDKSLARRARHRDRSFRPWYATEPTRSEFDWSGTAFAHFIAGRYDDASTWAQKGLWQQANYQTLLIIAPASHALGGRLAEARQVLAHLRELNPELRVSNIKDWAPFSRPEDLARLEDGLRKAGLPD